MCASYVYLYAAPHLCVGEIKMNSFDEFRLLINDLEKANVRYALVGGVAMAFHDEPRFTEDIDLIVFTDDLIKFKKLIETKGYFESTDPWTFQNINITLHRFIKIVNDEHMIIDALIPELDIAKTIIKNAVIAESENGQVRIASKEDIIWLKSFRNSKQDQADIERLKNDKN